MRWPIIRLIWFRELRDQLRDRRTVLMIAVLPIVLYPLLGLAVVHFAMGFSEKPSVIGIVGSEYLPEPGPASSGLTPLPALGWLEVLAAPPSSPFLRLDSALGATALFRVAHAQQDYPPLLVDGRFCRLYFEEAYQQRTLSVELLAGDDRRLLDNKRIDVLVQVPPEFSATLRQEGRALLQLSYREDERSRLASRRLYAVHRQTPALRGLPPRAYSSDERKG